MSNFRIKEILQKTKYQLKLLFIEIEYLQNYLYVSNLERCIPTKAPYFFPWQSSSFTHSYEKSIE